MATRRLTTEIVFDGGWATDFGPNFSAAPGQDGRLRIPFLVNAENIIYELDGAVHKMGGGTRLNSTAITAAPDVLGIFDYWKSGTALSPVQKRIAHAGTQIWKEDLDGVWDSIATGLESGKIPAYMVFNDIVVMATDSTTDVPQKWNQTDASTSNLGGTPPNFSFAVAHKNRGWAAGVAANPSRLHFTVLEDVEDWVGSGSGSIDISPDDGDIITGLWPEHKDRLWVFKGPNHGSIHMITGSAPTGSDAFARVPFVRGIGAVNHNGIRAWGDDLAFASHLGLHSLAATDAFGDFSEAFLSFPFGSYYKDSLNHARLEFTWAANYRGRGLLCWTFSRAGQTENDVILAMDYRFRPFRWSQWFVPNAASLALVSNSSVPELWAGDYSGFVLRLDRVDRNMAGTAYNGRATLPFVNFGNSWIEKTAAKAFIGLQPKGNYNLTFGFLRDNGTQQTVTVSQAGGDVLGTATANQFTLDTSTLAGGRFVTQPLDLEGTFLDLQIELSNTGNNEDMEVHSVGLHMDVGGIVEEAA